MENNYEKSAQQQIIKNTKDKSKVKTGKKTQAKSKTSAKAAAKSATKTSVKKTEKSWANKSTIRKANKMLIAKSAKAASKTSPRTAKISFRTKKRPPKQTKAEKGAMRGAKTRRQIKFFVSVLSILVLNLTLNIVNKLIKWQTGTIDAYWLTGIGMIIVLLLY